MARAATASRQKEDAVTYMGGPAGPMMVPALGCYYSGGFCGKVVRDASLCLDDQATLGVLGQGDDEWVKAQQAAGGVAGIAGAISNFIGQLRATVTGQPKPPGPDMTPAIVVGGVAVAAVAAYFLLRRRKY